MDLTGNEHVPFSPRCRSATLFHVSSLAIEATSIYVHCGKYFPRQPYGRFLSVQQQNKNSAIFRAIFFFILFFFAGISSFYYPCRFCRFHWKLCCPTNGRMDVGSQRNSEPIDRLSVDVFLTNGTEYGIAISGQWMCGDRSFGSTANVDQKECRIVAPVVLCVTSPRSVFRIWHHSTPGILWRQCATSLFGPAGSTFHSAPVSSSTFSFVGKKEGCCDNYSQHNEKKNCPHSSVRFFYVESNGFFCRHHCCYRTILFPPLVGLILSGNVLILLTLNQL